MNKNRQATTAVIAFLLAMAMLLGSPHAIGRELTRESFGTLQDHQVPVNEYCPVSPDEPIEPDLYIDFEGERIGFCCKKCVTKFGRSPEFFAADLASVRLVPLVANPSVVASNSITNAQGQGLGTDSAQHAEGDIESLDHDDGGQDEHDHQTGHGSGSLSLFQKVLTLGGKLHPLVVHLPIGLGLFAALAEGIFLLRGDRAWRRTATSAMLIGAISALVAVGLGLLAADSANFPRSLASTLEWHRIGGLSLTAWLIGGALASRKAIEGTGALFRIFAFGAAPLIAVVGHLGGTLVFGQGYFSL